MRVRAMVSKDHLLETAYQEYNGHVNDDVTLPQKFEAQYLNNRVRYMVGSN